MMDNIAKAIIANEGVPLTLKQHDAIVSKIKNQADEAHAEMLACKGMVPIGMIMFTFLLHGPILYLFIYRLPV